MLALAVPSFVFDGEEPRGRLPATEHELRFTLHGQGVTMDNEPSEFKVYLYANLLFWAFLVLLALGIFISCGAHWDEVMAKVFKFIFLVLGLGFTLVSVLDASYGYFEKKAGGGEG